MATASSVRSREHDAASTDAGTSSTSQGTGQRPRSSSWLMDSPGHNRESYPGECLHTRNLEIRDFVRGRLPTEPQDLCFIVWTQTSGQFMRRKVTIATFHRVIGLFFDGAAAIAAYLQSSVRRGEAGSASLKAQKAMFCSFNPFSKEDIRVEVVFPGSVNSCAVSINGDERSVSDRMWRQAKVASTLRTLALSQSDEADHLDPTQHLRNPFETPSAFASFVDAAQKLLWEGAPLPSCLEDNTGATDTVVRGVMQAFLARYQLRQGIHFFSRMVPFNPNAARFSATLIRHAACHRLDLDVAKAALARACLATKCRDSQLLSEQARLLLLQHRIPAALELAAAAAETSNSWRAWTTLAEVYVAAGEPVRALLAINNACANLPASHVHHTFKSGEPVPPRRMWRPDYASPGSKRVQIPFQDARAIHLNSVSLSEQAKTLYKVLVLVRQHLGHERFNTAARRLFSCQSDDTGKTKSPPAPPEGQSTADSRPDTPSGSRQESATPTPMDGELSHPSSSLSQRNLDYIKPRPMSNCMGHFLALLDADCDAYDTFKKRLHPDSVKHFGKHDWYKLGLLCKRLEDARTARSCFTNALTACGMKSALRIRILYELMRMSIEDHDVALSVAHVRELGVVGSMVGGDPRLTIAIEHCRRLMFKLIVDSGLETAVGYCELPRSFTVAQHILDNPFDGSAEIARIRGDVVDLRSGSSSSTAGSTAVGQTVEDLALHLLEEAAAWSVPVQSTLAEQGSLWEGDVTGMANDRSSSAPASDA